MAAGNIPRFDDETAEYQEEPSYCRVCNHRDCESVRRLRASICKYCGNGFIHCQRYYTISSTEIKEYAHADCEEEIIAKKGLNPETLTKKV